MIFRYHVTERDPDRPWVVLGTRTGLSIEARGAQDFHEKTTVEWPPDRYSVELEPGELVRSIRA